jgi:hypothetical protein
MKKKTNRSLKEDMSPSLIDSIQKAIKESVSIKKKFYYWHDRYPEGKYTVHVHKFKCPAVLSRSTLYKICDHLEELGFYGFQPTSESTENWSGVTRYCKTKA